MNDYGTVLCEAPRDRAVSSYAEDVAGCLKEANAILDALCHNLFGPKVDKQDDMPKPPVSCLQDQLAMNAEQSRIVVNRLAELNARIFG